MSDAQTGIDATLFIVPPDAKVLLVSELAPRLRARIGPVDVGQSVVTRPGFRVTTRLVPGPLAALLAEFRVPSLLTDAVIRFARAHDQDPDEILELAFDALATMVEARILVPAESPDASAPQPSLAAGQDFAGFEIQALVRSLEDSEVYRAHTGDGVLVALKLARADRSALVATFAHEARVLAQLDGEDSPALLGHGIEGGRAYLAMTWCDGVSIAVAAQGARAARDRRRLHALVGRMLDAYRRLHARGVLHGDVHPGNCLAGDDGRVVILDFGNARTTDRAEMVDLMRTGIPQFHDPQLASAVLAGELTPAVTEASEQYAVAVLAYLLLTGLQPIDSPAIHDELLRRIVSRPPSPFAARCVAAWPDVEAVLARALAKEPAQRFPNVAAFSRSFLTAEIVHEVTGPRHAAAQRAFDSALASVRSLTPSGAPRDAAWFALRAAIALDDAELLAAADVLTSRAGSGWAAQCCAVLVARARSDNRKEDRAIERFLDSTVRLTDPRDTATALLAAARMLDGGMSRSPRAAALADWVAQSSDRLMRAPMSSHEATCLKTLCLASVALTLARTGAVAIDADLPERLESLVERGDGDVWLWSAAYDVFGDPRFRALALGAPLPRTPLRRAFALLRLHQLTGDVAWIADARRLVSRAPNMRLPERQTALLVTELMAPERAILPLSLLPVLQHQSSEGRRTLTSSHS